MCFSCQVSSFYWFFRRRFFQVRKVRQVLWFYIIETFGKVEILRQIRRGLWLRKCRLFQKFLDHLYYKIKVQGEVTITSDFWGFITPDNWGSITPGTWKFGFGERTAMIPGTYKFWIFWPCITFTFEKVNKMMKHVAKKIFFV